MEVLAIITVPLIVGGAFVAYLMFRVNRRRPSTAAHVGEDPLLSTDVINMARIRVAGIGGLGLVAMALATAYAVPRIGQTLTAGAVLGVCLAAALILWRRHEGPMPSSGGRPGANTTLSIDEPAATRPKEDGSHRPASRQELGASALVPHN